MNYVLPPKNLDKKFSATKLTFFYKLEFYFISMPRMNGIIICWQTSGKIKNIETVIRIITQQAGIWDGARLQSCPSYTEIFQKKI